MPIYQTIIPTPLIKKVKLSARQKRELKSAEQNNDFYAVPIKIWTNDIAPEAIEQLKNIAQLPIVPHHVSAMPDVHKGIGATVGSVIPTRKAIIPAAVGVDIGCGMNAVRLSLTAEDLPENLKPLRLAIEAKVPVGFAKHRTIDDKIQGRLKNVELPLIQLLQKHPELEKMALSITDTWTLQLGSLGGGNHFIELCLDEQKNVWIMLHSGSRGIGNIIGRYFIEQAKNECAKNNVHLPDQDLAYFSEGSELFHDYFNGVSWAQNYAMMNRKYMMELVIEAIKPLLPSFTITEEAINCHHNYVQKEWHYNEELYITRKGAINASKGALGIIPGSMGAKSYIVRGLGNEESFCSCSHGAGRKMSRTAAKNIFSTEDLIKQTQGIECRKDEHVIDEIPSAYKDIDVVMNQQTDLVEVMHTLKQVLCIKG